MWNIAPEQISSDLQNLTCKVKNFEPLKKNSALCENLKRMRIKKLFPVQEAVISFMSRKQSVLVRPRDLCVAAPTGSGKTLAYVLPIIQNLQASRGTKLRAMVMIPTRSLGLQVLGCFEEMLQNIDLKVMLVCGKRSTSDEKCPTSFDCNWNRMSEINCDILIVTPGKLVEYLVGAEDFDLSDLKYLVIDECDRLLDETDQDWLYHLVNHFEKDLKMERAFRPLACLSAFREKQGPQKLLFSATLLRDLDLFYKIGLFEPQFFCCAGKQTFLKPKELSEKLLIAPAQLKPLYLFILLESESFRKTLIFVDSVTAVDRLCMLLKVWFKNSPIRIDKWSSQMNVAYQTKAIEDFRSNKTNILVSTDALARGIDIVKVDCVINYDRPRFPVTYMHRSGRTARAGNEGVVISLIEPENETKFLRMLKKAKRDDKIEKISIDANKISKSQPKYRKSLGKLKKKVTTINSSKLKKNFALKRQSCRST